MLSFNHEIPQDFLNIEDLSQNCPAIIDRPDYEEFLKIKHFLDLDSKQ
jgi:hypothetical protein